MSTLLGRSLFLALVALPQSLLAEPATPEGAATITEALTRYLPASEGLIRVTPAGEGYTTVIDLASYADRLPADAGTLQIAPLTLTLTDLGDGKWQVDSAPSLDVSLDVPGEVSMTLTSEGLDSHGVFDTGLMAFTSNSIRAGSVTMHQAMTDATGMSTTVDYRLSDVVYDSTATAGTEGGLDTRSTMRVGPVVEEMTMAVPGQAPNEFTLRADSYVMEADLTGLRAAGLFDLVSWLVAHRSEAEIRGDEAGLRERLQAALPIWANLDGTTTLRGVALQTDLGPFAATSVSIGVGMHGVVADGLFREAISAEDVSIPPGLAPDWATPLLPTDMSFDLAVKGFDLAAPAALMLGAPSLFAPPPPDLRMQMLHALLPRGTVEATLTPGAVRSAIYDLAVEGRISAGPDRMPDGTARITLTGIEAILDALKTAPEDIRSGTVQGLLMARGMGRSDGPDTTVWDVEMTADGKLTVNGNDLTPLLKP